MQSAPSSEEYSPNKTHTHNTHPPCSTCAVCHSLWRLCPKRILINCFSLFLFAVIFLTLIHFHNCSRCIYLVSSISKIFFKEKKALILNFPTLMTTLGFPGSSAGKEPASNAGDSSSIPRSGRSPGEEIGYLFQDSWASLVAQTVKNSPAMWETWVWSLGWEDPLEESMVTFSGILAWRILMDRGAWGSAVSGVPKSWDTTEQLSTAAAWLP